MESMRSLQGCDASLHQIQTAEQIQLRGDIKLMREKYAEQKKELARNERALAEKNTQIEQLTVHLKKVEYSM